MTEVLVNIKKETAIIEGHRNMFGHVGFEESGTLLRNTASLITTIESQKEEIKKLLDERKENENIIKRKLKIKQDAVDKAMTEIQSQKEEIANLRRHQDHFIYGESEEGHTFIERLERELASYKAITELAVKGLKEISQFKHYPDDHYNHSFQKIQRKSVTTLSEIERLSNA